MTELYHRIIPVRAALERINRRCRRIVYPARMRLEWNYKAGIYELHCPENAVKTIGPIVARDLLPLLRYLGGFKPGERERDWAVELRNGQVIPEGKLRPQLHFKFTSALLRQVRVQLKKPGDLPEIVTFPLDVSVVDEALGAPTPDEVEYAQP